MAFRPCSTTSSCSGSVLAPNIPPVSTRENGTPCHSAGWAIESRVVPAIGVDDGAPRVGDAVEQGGLADVGPADQHDRGERSGTFQGHVRKLS